MKNLYKYGLMALAVVSAYNCAQAMGGMKPFYNQTDLTLTSVIFYTQPAYAEGSTSKFAVPFGPALQPSREQDVFIPEFNKPLVLEIQSQGKKGIIHNVVVTPNSNIMIYRIKGSKTELMLEVVSKDAEEYKTYKGKLENKKQS